MKKIILLFTLTLLFSCSKDSSTPEVVVVKDDIKPPFIVKYEVSFSTNNYKGSTHVEYSYEDNGVFRYWSEPGTWFLLNSREISAGWSRTFTVTVNTNPLPLEITTDFNPVTNAIVYFKIYVNSVLVKDEAINVKPNNNGNVDYLNGISYDVY